jgi:hypothetical protein
MRRRAPAGTATCTRGLGESRRQTRGLGRPGRSTFRPGQASPARVRPGNRELPACSLGHPPMRSRLPLHRGRPERSPRRTRARVSSPGARTCSSPASAPPPKNSRASIADLESTRLIGGVLEGDGDWHRHPTNAGPLLCSGCYVRSREQAVSESGAYRFRPHGDHQSNPAGARGDFRPSRFRWWRSRSCRLSRCAIADQVPHRASC